MEEIFVCGTCKTTLDSRKDGVYEYFDREYLKRITSESWQDEVNLAERVA